MKKVDEPTVRALMHPRIPLLFCAALLLSVSARAEDLPAPKPAPGHYSRVILHVEGSNRALDYSDVIKIHSTDGNGITFETADGFVIIHRGPFTLIGPKSEFADRTEPGGRVRFFDPK